MTVTVDTGREPPFLGLRYFDEEHAHLFFGRDEQVNDLLEKIRVSRLVTVMGSSGSGKSSLVRSGVIPRLKAGMLAHAGPRWRVAKARPGGSPIRSLARALEGALATEGLEVTLRRGPLGLVQAVTESRLPADDNVLVIADQFEELFRYQRESNEPEHAKEEAVAFVKLLLEATAERALPIYVIVTMRSDYLGNCAQFRDLPERINEGLYLVPRMRRDQLEQAIAGPIAVEDAEITPRLLQQLLNETGDDPDQLPVLQHALLRTWNAWNRSTRAIDLGDLDAAGGMKDSLARHADEIFKRLLSEEQRVARILFQQLTERDAEGREIRRPTPVSVVAAVAGASVEAVERIVERFAAPDAALIYRNEDGHLDITHESLIRKWGRIQGTAEVGAGGKGWIQEEVDARDRYRLLVERAARNDLLRAGALDDAIRWRALGLNAEWAKRYGKTGGPNTFDEVVRFIEASRREVQRARRRRTALISGAMWTLVVVIVVVSYSWRSATDAAQRAQLALAQRSTQEAVRLIAEGRTDHALAHLAQALRASPGEPGATNWVSALVLHGHLWLPTQLIRTERSDAAAFSPDGRRIVVTCQNDTGQVFDAASGQPVGAVFAHDSDPEFFPAKFSPDGRYVLSAPEAATAQLLDALTGKAVGPPLAHKDAITSAVYSPDGRQILTASLDGTVRLWDAATGAPVGEPLDHGRRVFAAAFSPDGQRIVTASGNNAELWDVSTRLPIGTMLQHRNEVLSASFSPDGSRIVTASADISAGDIATESTAQLWDATTHQPIGDPMRHAKLFYLRGFSSDGKRVLTYDVDGSVARIWDVTGQPVARVLQHTDEVRSASFSPDGRQVITASEDETAHLWDAESGNPVGVPLHHDDAVESAAFSGDGRQVVTATAGGVRVWKTAPGPVTLAHDDRVLAAAFSPDGSRVLTAAGNFAVMWNAASGEAINRLQHDNPVSLAALSSDGRRIVTASGSTTRWWDVSTGQSTGAALQHEGRPFSLSPDRRYMATAAKTEVRLWDLTASQPVGAALSHDKDVIAATFAADGRRVVTLTSLPFNGTASIWAVPSGERIGQVLRLQRDVFTAEFSPDGRYLVTAWSEGARLLDAAGGAPMGGSFTGADAAYSAAFSPDGRRIVTAHATKALLWDAETRRSIGAPMPHGYLVHSATFSPDGRLILTVSDDNRELTGPISARVWNAVTGQPLSLPFHLSARPSSVTFSPDGHRMLTWSDDNIVRLWDVMLNSDSPQASAQLAAVAELFSGHQVNDSGSVILLTQAERLDRIRQIAGPDAGELVAPDVLLRRLLPGR